MLQITLNKVKGSKDLIIVTKYARQFNWDHATDKIEKKEFILLNWKCSFCPELHSATQREFFNLNSLNSLSILNIFQN